MNVDDMLNILILCINGILDDILGEKTEVDYQGYRVSRTESGFAIDGTEITRLL